jgi:hypothetical protein
MLTSTKLSAEFIVFAVALIMTAAPAAGQVRGRRKPRQKIHIFNGRGPNWNQDGDIDRAWTSIGQKWSDWQPCNKMEAYTEACKPADPTCAKVHTCQPSKMLGPNAGLGSQLKTDIGPQAEQAFAAGCSYSLLRAEETKCPFDLGAYSVLPPSQIPSKYGPGCTLFAITQPHANISNHLASHKISQPLVGFHVRSGWADLMRNMPAEWASLQCDASGENASLSATTQAIGYETDDTTWHTLDAITENIVKAADEAFGHNNWDLFLATDSPAVVRLVNSRLRDRIRKLLHHGTSHPGAHSNPNDDFDPIKSAAAISNFSSTAISDFIALSEADMLFHLPSTFPAAAYARTDFCPRKRRLELKSNSVGRNTHRRVMRVGELFRKGFGTNGLGVPRSDWEAVMPRGAMHPCLSSTSTEEEAYTSCACWWRLALGSEPTQDEITQLDTGAEEAADFLECQSCVAAGFGWSIRKGKCGGYANQRCPTVEL